MHLKSPWYRCMRLIQLRTVPLETLSLLYDFFYPD
jgi:hypothetical protein